ncbi:MAG: transposase [Candidatus Nealsonbacteria bacterium]|nr:transposase [Candidatus Nealsonbacteria bacterium]
MNIWRRRQVRQKEEQILRGMTLKKSLLGHTSQTPEREKLVDVMAFSFMPNHIHLILKQLKDNGISRFMQKAGTGYATYFNKKFKRIGHLFGRFRSVLIKTDEQLQNTFVYVHTNAAALVDSGFKENGVENPEETIKFLTKYRWHSYADYLSEKKFQSVTKRDFLLQLMGGSEGCRKAVNDWISYKKDLKDAKSGALE